MMDILAYYGLSYPDTAAGLAACNAEGKSVVAGRSGVYAGYECILGNPNVDRYNLWVWIFS
jgi:hypothetical protein